MRRTGPSRISRTGAVVLAAALLFAGEARGRSRPAAGFSNLFGNMFSGQKSATPAQAQPAPAAAAAPRCPGAARTAPPAIR